MATKRLAETPSATDERLERGARGVQELLRAASELEKEFAAELESVEPSLRDSARNLVQYLAVRRHDIRELQHELHRMGLTSLGRLEAHVMASLQAVLRAIRALRGEDLEPMEAPPVTFDSGDERLARHAKAILGAAPREVGTRIMVTAPGEAADDPGLIRDLVEGGMGIMRINCAHGGTLEWKRMVNHLRRAETETGRRCLVSFDLAGPKLRTGAMAPGPAVMKWRPKRDSIGRVLEPARVRFVAAMHESDAADGAIPVSAELAAAAAVGDGIELVDVRGRKRVLEVVEQSPDNFTCETETTAYVVPGTRLALKRAGAIVAEGIIGDLPRREQWIELHAGDTLELLRGEAPGQDAAHDEEGRLVCAPSISCAVGELFEGVRVGEPILFDDGKIRGVIREVRSERLRIEIATVVGGAAKLRAEKGINVPESDLALAALTPKDLGDLDFIVQHADMVAISFVQRPRDIEALVEALAARGASRLGIILKIETQAAFDRLPSLLLTAMRHKPLAVMAARGDLGVEVGFERLSEVQEEILWLCEAAHVPVIWATQVLESLAKGGIPSRAEVTDAAMGSRAECVMLNKGPYIRETLRFLVDVLRRMEEHQHKKTARLRKLRVSEGRRARVKTAVK